MESLDEAVQTWRDSLKENLLSQLPTTPNGSPQPESAFRLATSMFIAFEQTTLYYPNVLHHSNISGKPIRHYSSMNTSWCIGHSSCPTFSIRYDTHGVKILMQLLKECGLDFRTTTPADLDALDARFLCLTCARPENGEGTGAGGPVMTWRRAVRIPRPSVFSPPSLFFPLIDECANPPADLQIRHGRGWQHDLGSCTEWRVLNELEAARVRALEEASGRRPANPSAWSCNHCRASNPSHVIYDFGMMTSHLAITCVRFPPACLSPVAPRHIDEMRVLRLFLMILGTAS